MWKARHLAGVGSLGFGLVCGLRMPRAAHTLPPPPKQLKGTARERAAMARQDGQTNLAEAGTLSMEFTTLGRLTGGGLGTGPRGWVQGKGGGGPRGRPPPAFNFPLPLDRRPRRLV